MSGEVKVEKCYQELELLLLQYFGSFLCLLVKVSIAFSPWMGDKLKDEIREFIKKQTINEKIEIICKDSNFDGTIDPK